MVIPMSEIIGVNLSKLSVKAASRPRLTSGMILHATPAPARAYRLWLTSPSYRLRR